MKTILVDAMDTFVIEGEGIYQPLYDLLETYPNKKIVLTMAPDELMEKWGLNTLPYEVFSSKLNPKKTDPAYYTQVLDRYALTKDAVVYFEHSPEAVAKAQSVGIETHYYDSDKKDLVALKEFLDTHLS